MKSGFVSIIGKPNAGKSTLLNALLGQKLVITTPKAQTTRHRILGIDSEPEYQIVYSDTPGVIKPKYKLHEKMMNYVGYAVADADVLVLMIAMDEKYDESDVMAIAQKTDIPRIMIINKTDISTPEKTELRKKEVSSLISFTHIFEICALKKTWVEEIKRAIIDLLPEGSPYYDPESVSDRNERFFVAELIREQIFMQMSDEIPYSSDVNIMQFQEKEDITVIHAEIYVERLTQKAMVIGKNGSRLKQIGAAARKNIESFLEKKVYLELYVKVRDNWKDNMNQLKHLGYTE